jgi:hypothetical protein
MELTGGSLFEAVAMVRPHGPKDLDGSQWLCSIYVSDDGKNWGKPMVKNAVLQPKVHTEQQIRFPTPTNKKFIKFEITDAVSAPASPLRRSANSTCS